LTELTEVDDVPGAFAALVAQAFAERPGPRFSIMLSGGPLARTCYERLAALAPGVIDWTLVDAYLGDERVVPPEDRDANQRLVREALVDPVGALGSFTPMPTDGDPETCAAEYDETLSGVLADGGIDLVHLGMGPDGHTASLFPGASSLDAGPDQLVVATEDPTGANPHPRLTITLPAIARARRVVFTVSGPDKREAMARLVRGDDIPAARVRNADVRWLVDAQALGEPS
jgi:6-phosphogluconolactonase